MNGQDGHKTAVKTYIPETQKQRWQSDADELEMSQSEFVRTMVQAGRRELGLEQADPDADPGGRGLETYLQTVLADEHRSWDELSEQLLDDLEATLADLQDAGAVRHSGRHGGYTYDGSA
jgi:hypothetical protein